MKTFLIKKKSNCKVLDQKRIMSKINCWSKLIFGENHTLYKACTIYDSLYVTVYARDIILHSQQSIIITKAHVKFQPNWLYIFIKKATEEKKHINYTYLCILQTSSSSYVSITFLKLYVKLQLNSFKNF